MMKKRAIPNIYEEGCIQNWLLLDKEGKQNHCPFDGRCNIKGSTGYCYKFFPFIKGRKEKLKIRRKRVFEFRNEYCPCDLYSVFYVTKIARELIKNFTS